MKKGILPVLMAVTGIAAVAAAGICHGIWTERWNEDDRGSASHLDLAQVPALLGDWQGEAPSLEEEDGLIYYSRRYVNRSTGRPVMLALTYGKPGPVAVHTPDVCYESNGFEITSPVKFIPRTADGDSPHQFFTSQFRKKTPTGPQVLRIFWAWHTDGSWLAPDNPRLVFARYPRLLKLYLINEASTENAPPDNDPCLEFMPVILPAIQNMMGS